MSKRQPMPFTSVLFDTRTGELYYSERYYTTAGRSAFYFPSVMLKRCYYTVAELATGDIELWVLPCSIDKAVTMTRSEMHTACIVRFDRG